MPTGFGITNEYHGILNTTLTFEWDPFQGSGPESVVDHFVLSISPQPLSSLVMNVVPSPPWNVTISYNTVYNVNITAVNCAGDGRTITALNEIKYSKFYIYNKDIL